MSTTEQKNRTLELLESQLEKADWTAEWLRRIDAHNAQALSEAVRQTRWLKSICNAVTILAFIEILRVAVAVYGVLHFAATSPLVPLP